VWSPRQLAAFLDYVRDERLYALWRLVALRGLRRSEAIGLPWDNVDLDRRLLTISQQLTVDASTFAVSLPTCRRSASTTSATAPPASPTSPAPTSKPSRTNSATPASF
jgi:integrase